MCSTQNNDLILLTVVSTEFDMNFVPHMQAFWTAMGVTESRVVYHRDGEPTVDELSRIEAYRKNWPGEHTSTLWAGVFTSPGKTAHLMDLWERHVKGRDCLYVAPDADEYPEYESPHHCYHQLNDGRHPVCYGTHTDRFAREAGQVGTLSADSTKPLESQFPVAIPRWCARHVGGDPIRPVVLHASTPCRGIHSNRKYSKRRFRVNHGHHVTIAHYKWTDRRHEKAARRVLHWKALPDHKHWRTSEKILQRIGKQGDA